jgi:hypothetical protein
VSFVTDGSENVLFDDRPIVEKDFRPEEIAQLAPEDVAEIEVAINLAFQGDVPAPRPGPPTLREMLTEAVRLHRASPSVAITAEKRVNAVLHAVAAWADREAVGRSVLREEDHGYWYVELANDLRNMIEWPEFLAEEAAQELTRQAQGMEWMRP